MVCNSKGPQPDANPDECPPHPYVLLPYVDRHLSCAGAPLGTAKAVPCGGVNAGRCCGRACVEGIVFGLLL